jgi:uncharacterized Fe-S cluster-containing radical SAM superfamily protein
MLDHGFAEARDGQVFRVEGSIERPERLRTIRPEELAPIEQRARALDRSPALYHWNNLLFEHPDGRLEVVYARGKDFVPFKALDHVEHLIARRRDPSLGPATLQIQPNQVCNDDCVFCCTAEYRQKPIYRGHRFSAEEWIELLERHAASGGEMVEIIGGGEPTLHPDIVRVLRRIPELGLRAYLFTNGSRFTSHDGELNLPLLDAIAEACAILTVSLDGHEHRDRVHRLLSPERTRGTLRAMEYIHRRRDPARMAFYNSFILTGGPNQPSNLEDLYPSVERQAGWVDAIHVQNDFMSLSHFGFETERAQEVLQSTIDDFFKDIYVYYNFPLISRFHLRVPYSLSTHNVPSSAFSRCLRAHLAPTVECGSYKAWPCGKYAGEAQPEDQSSFARLHDELVQLRRSPDHKNGISCDPCIYSSYNQSLLAIDRLLETEPQGRFLHFYERAFVEATMTWPRAPRPAPEPLALGRHQVRI